MTFSSRSSALLALFLFAILAASASSALACTNPLLIRVSEVYPPYAWKNADNSFAGLDVKLIERIMNHADCPYELTTVPWSRALQQLAGGNLSGVATAFRSTEREAFARFSEPYRYQRIRLFTRSDDRRFDGITSLDEVIERELMVTIQAGTYRGPMVAAFIEKYEDSPYVDFVQASSNTMKMVAIGRIDAHIEDLVAGETHLHEHGLQEQVIAHPFEIYDAPIHLMFSRASVSPATVAHINNSITSVLAPRQARASRELISD